MEYMVSSIGFDRSADLVNVTAEIIVTDSSGSESAAEAKSFSASGSTADGALYSLSASLSKGLMLNHCGLLVLGQTLTQEDISEIFEICLKNKDITQAIRIVAAEAAEELLSLKPTSQIALGYEISKLLEQSSEYTGTEYKNRFYEIEARREGKASYYALPLFKAEEELARLDGLRLYSYDKQVEDLKNDEVFLYSLMSDSFRSGRVQAENKSFFASREKIRYTFSYEKEKLYVRVAITLDTDDEGLKLINSQLKSEKIIKTDVYGIADRISKKEPLIWQGIKDDYKTVFKNAQVVFEGIKG